MKRYFILICFLSVFGASCSDNILDRGPLDKYSEQNVWKDSTLINLYLGNIYAGMLTTYDEGGSFLMACLTDEAESARTFHTSQQVNLGQYNPSNNIYSEYWTTCYQQARKCNMLLERLPGAAISEGLKQRMTGEARLLRALAYMQLYDRFGRFPIISKVMTLDDETTVPRAKEEDCVKFILTDFDEAAKLLPLSYNAANLGRATSWAALALKSRFLLNQRRDAEAAEAALAVINSKQYDLFPDFMTLFNPENDNNKEIIFDKQYASGISGQSHSLDTYETSTFFTGFASGITCPTQNLVDAFEMKDGLAWDKSPLYSAAKPYDNRDPRFYATVMYDGCQWMGEKVDMKKGSKFNRASGSGSSPTNYFLRKFLNPKYDHKNTNGNANFQNCAIIRLAEVYLIYAEAKWNLGATEDARTYVNKLRTRAGMPNIAAADFTFAKLQNERFVELAMEGQRWFDIRRWKAGPAKLGGVITGMDIVDGPGGRVYNRINVETRVFAEKMYLFPVPLSEINRYPAGTPLDQNPLWN